MSNSPLISQTILSPNHSGKRTKPIDTIVIHCIVGQWSMATLGKHFANSAVKASSNYGCCVDGIILCVDEANRSWCTSSAAVDQRAVTIEVATDATSPYAVREDVYKNLILLVTDICSRNNIKELVWSTNKTTRINWKNGVNMQVHRDWAAKACPGDYLYNRQADIAAQVNALLKKEGDVLENMTEERLIEIIDARIKANMPVKYEYFKDIPEWAQPTTQKLMDKGSLNGTGVDKNGETVLDLSNDVVRLLTINDREGLYK